MINRYGNGQRTSAYGSPSSGWNECTGESGESLLTRIREVEFAMQEIVLYLDAYPDSEVALLQFHKLRTEREKLVSSYESRFGPLTAFGNESACSWDWIRDPWPWDLDAN